MTTGQQMRGLRSVLARLSIGFPLLTLAASATAGWTSDPALRTETVKDADGGEISCTFYRDFMIRVPGTDTPSPGNATLVRPGKAPVTCSPGTQAGLSLETEEYAFMGRTGVYLFFEVANPFASVPFRIVDSRTGRTIIDDVTEDGLSNPATIRTMKATPKSLSLAFRRALNTQCSVLAKPEACWRAITSKKDNGVPPEIARLAPPTKACAKTYGDAGIDSNDPSVISYDVQVAWLSGRRRNQITASGPVGCWPLP